MKKRGIILLSFFIILVLCAFLYNGKEYCNDYGLDMSIKEIVECSCPSDLVKIVNEHNAICVNNSMMPCEVDEDCSNNQRCLSPLVGNKSWSCVSVLDGCYYQNKENPQLICSG